MKWALDNHPNSRITKQCTGVAVPAKSEINVAGGNPVIVNVMQQNRMRVRSVEIGRPDEFECAYGLVESDGADLPPVLVTAFRGTYPNGSRGNAHGHFISNSTVHGLAAFDPWCLILDFREMTYEWGNTLLSVFDNVNRFMDEKDDESEVPFPIVVVTSQKCETAFLSLVTRSGNSPPDWHFNDLDRAIEYAVKQAREWIDA
ncbi:MAG: hypothetical protein NXI04_24255 [Planctomycetaceae bacterium]|nr:hypothetical protein [Planctomycetaceae bacterium]